MCLIPLLVFSCDRSWTDIHIALLHFKHANYFKIFNGINDEYIYHFKKLIVKEHIAQSFQKLQILQNTFSRFYQLYHVKVE